MKLEAQFDPKDLDRIKRALTAVNPQARGNIVFKAIQLGSLFLNEKLKKYDTYSTLGKVTGRLHNSIGSNVETKGKFIIGVIGSGASPFAGRVPYASIHETGGAFIPARHYMSKTLNANESAAIKKVVGVIDDELRKVLSK
jgi:phage gpG-like protein